MFKKRIKDEVKPAQKVVESKIMTLPKSKIIEASLKTEVKRTPRIPADKATPESLGKQKNAVGRSHLKTFLAGGQINLKQAIQAKCYDCMGFYEDGIADCEQYKCPLYPFHPYNPSPARLRASKKKKE